MALVLRRHCAPLLFAHGVLVRVATMGAVMLIHGAAQDDGAVEVSCSNAPNCSSRLREPCNRRGAVANACGNCFEGTHGAFGPLNTKCMSNSSCGIIFPGQDGCPGPAGDAPLPFILPFGSCVCDEDGKSWPTAGGKCATVITDLPLGSGVYRLLQCPTASCNVADCLVLASWESFAQPFDCAKSGGSDSYALADDCAARLAEFMPGSPPYSALCRHPSQLAMRPLEGTEAYPVRCNLAPACPESVLGTERLEETCCVGNLYSHPITQWGTDRDRSAAGFCSTSLAPDSYGVLNDSIAVRHCNVRSFAPGWRGCACLGTDGLPMDRICTVSCSPPDCPLPENGIPATPEDWLTSEVPKQFQPGDRNENFDTKIATAFAALQHRVDFALLLMLMRIASLLAE